MSEKVHFEFCRENIEILYVSSTNKRVMSVLHYGSLLYYRFVQFNNLGDLGDAPHKS